MEYPGNFRFGWALPRHVVCRDGLRVKWKMATKPSLLKTRRRCSSYFERQLLSSVRGASPPDGMSNSRWSLGPFPPGLYRPPTAAGKPPRARRAGGWFERCSAGEPADDSGPTFHFSSRRRCQKPVGDADGCGTGRHDALWRKAHALERYSWTCARAAWWNWINRCRNQSTFCSMAS